MLFLQRFLFYKETSLKGSGFTKKLCIPWACTGEGIISWIIMITLHTEATSLLKLISEQAAIIDEATRDIATGTAEQMNSMNQSLKTIERLSEMASEVAQVNEKIIEMTKTIIEKSEELSRVVNAYA